MQGLIESFPPPGTFRIEDERFCKALVFSLLVHIAIIVFWVPQLRNKHETGASPLTVMLAKPASASQAVTQSQVISPSPKKTTILTTVSPSSDTPHVTPRGIKQQTVNTNPAISIQKRDLTTPVLPKNAGKEEERRPGLRPGEASMVMEIGDNGVVGQIIWNQLPALTDDQLFRLEAAIREHYRLQSESGRFVRQVIDIRDFLGSGVMR